MAKRRKRTSKNVPAKGRLRDMADQLWSNAVRADWNNVCAVCSRYNMRRTWTGNKRRIDAHHLIPRENEATRYDLRNGIALCANCHRFDPEIAPHQNAVGWLNWLSENHPIRHEWYTSTVENGGHLAFNGTKNHIHYIDVIQRLREYVGPDDFVRIVGVRFSEYLDAERMAE